MAVTVVTKTSQRFQKDTVTITADGSAIITWPKLPVSLSICSDGVDGGGTLTWLVGNDGTVFTAIGLATSAAPTTFSVTSATAVGAWVAPPQSMAFEQLKLTLASSTNPTLVLVVLARF